MSLRDAANKPLTAFWRPETEAGTSVGAVKNGTFCSEQPTAPTRSAMLMASSARPELSGSVERFDCRYMCVMSEPEVQAEEVAASWRIRRDIDAARERLGAKGGNLGIETIVLPDAPEVVAGE